VPEAKPFDISKQLVWDAYQRVKANRGAAGVDGESLSTFEKDLKGNLYKIWNRMSSGSYCPPPVRPLGIPTVGDRVAQTVVKMVLEPSVEPVFHPDSYGYRPGKSALEAVSVARKRCWDADWVIDLDIKDFFGSISHELIERAVAHHTDLAWVRLYVGRWLRAPIQREDGTLERPVRGTPQGGVASPLLANLFMHYAFDAWMQRTLPSVPFERFADDAVVHCRSKRQAESVLVAIRERFLQCGLELHPTKTRIVYCKESDRRGTYEHVSFDFLGCHLHKRLSAVLWERTGKRLYFLQRWPSRRAMCRIRQRVRELTPRSRCHADLRTVIAELNPVLRGWGNYFRTGNAARKFVSLDGFVVRRLRSLRLKRKGHQLRPGEVCGWTREYFEHLGLHRLRGTPRESQRDGKSAASCPAYEVGRRFPLFSVLITSSAAD